MTSTGELPPCRGGIVELHLPAALLTELAADPQACGEWATVVADIAAQYTQADWPARSSQDPAARFAGAALRHHVQIRDRSCVYLGCRASARGADLDHTHDHAHGGPTTDDNSGPLCRHDHQLKTVGRWRLRQSEPGHFTWLSPLGRKYRTQPPPILDPILQRPPPQHHRPPAMGQPRRRQPILQRPPPQPDPAPLPAPPDADQPPPFYQERLARLR